MTLEKDLTPEQITDVEKLGQIKGNLSPQKWIFFKGAVKNTGYLHVKLNDIYCYKEASYKYWTNMQWEP